MRYHLALTAVLFVATGCTGSYSDWSKVNVAERSRSGRLDDGSAEFALARRAVGVARAEIFRGLSHIPANDVFCATSRRAPWAKGLMGALAEPRQGRGDDEVTGLNQERGHPPPHPATAPSAVNEDEGRHAVSGQHNNPAARMSAGKLCLGRAASRGVVGVG